MSTAAPLAPRWHTALLIALMLSVGITGLILTHGSTATTSSASQQTSRFVAYFPMVIVQWSLVLYVARIGRERSVLCNLLGERWRSSSRVVTDLALATVGCLLIRAVEGAWARWTTAGQNASVSSVLPHTSGETLAWILVALSAGFCEEVVYRGYLQLQLRALTGSAAAAITLQALLFGLAHAQQGGLAGVRIAIYGALFGILAQWRRSLLPGIACHIAIDLASGLLPR